MKLTKGSNIVSVLVEIIFLAIGGLGIIFEIAQLLGLAPVGGSSHRDPISLLIGCVVLAGFGLFMFLGGITGSTSSFSIGFGGEDEEDEEEENEEEEEPASFIQRVKRLSPKKRQKQLRQNLFEMELMHHDEVWGQTLDQLISDETNHLTVEEREKYMKRIQPNEKLVKAMMWFRHQL